jgi:hypothetical protein
MILFAAAIMFVIAVLLHYSTVPSRLTGNVLPAQEVAPGALRLDALDSAPSASPVSADGATGD